MKIEKAGAGDIQLCATDHPADCAMAANPSGLYL
jgi:hypothetical protein